jgi:hypothetical protein
VFNDRFNDQTMGIHVDSVANDGGLVNVLGLTLVTGWCFGTIEFYDFPFSWQWNNHPN